MVLQMAKPHWIAGIALLAAAGAAQALPSCDQYATASGGDTYEAGLARADAQFTLGNHEAVIVALEAVLAEQCAPLAGETAWQLVTAYLAERRPQDAEHALAPLLQRAEAEGTQLARAYALDWRVQCDIGQLRACVTAFMRSASRREVTADQARWFNFLLANIVKFRESRDLVRQAKAQGWIDWRNQAVANAIAATPLRAAGVAPGDPSAQP